MKFKKIKDEGNVIGYDLIEIIKFNYDGKGSALVKEDGKLGSLHPNDLNYVMFGNDSGEEYYQLIEG